VSQPSVSQSIMIDSNTLLQTDATVHCPKGTHNVITLGCVKNHLTKKKAFGLGCKMGFNDNPDEEAYIATGGFKNHSSAFTQGYNLAFGNGKDPSACRQFMK
jgi:hypothetical protein